MTKNDKCECGSNYFYIMSENDYGDKGVFRKKRCLQCGKINYFMEYRVEPSHVF